ncbi:MAG: hypothetical protein JRH11_17935, partial [Deltaproteobacteria bacterium]|nr:hypothetical protein [Deltaproteobacteria bacterium]
MPPTGTSTSADEELTVLMVGSGEPLSEALIAAMEHHGLAVEAVPSVGSTQMAIAVAPDFILLVGDATEGGGTEILGKLSASALAAVIPVILLADDETLADRLQAFRFGASAVVPRSASADGIAVRITELAREIPERAADVVGEIGEATLEEFASMLTGELRNGIISVRGESAADTVRIVLGEGRQLAELVESFVARVRPLVRQAEVVHYEFQEHSSGTLSLLGPELDVDNASDESIDGLRILLADNDVARADGVAQELRARGATVVMTDLAGSRLQRARSLDPSVLVIDEKALSGGGYGLVQGMRDDVRLRWAYLLVVSWDEIWSTENRGPVVESLVSRLGRLGAAETELREKAAAGEPFDARLEVIGAARLLRTLVASKHGLRLSVHNRRGLVQVDISDGLIAGATFQIKP